MSETAFLAAVAGFLREQPELDAAKDRIGFAEPAAAGELPAVVLSLEEVRRTRGGIGERAGRVEGASEVTAEIDLAAPALDGAPAPELISADRRQLTLPHGGLVRSDGAEGPLSGADLTVTVAGTPRTLVPNPPQGPVTPPPGTNEMRVEPETGRLAFGSPLPGAGVVTARYFVAQWQERTLTRLAGTLRADVCAAGAAQVESLSGALVDALVPADAPAAIPGLLWLRLTALGSVGASEEAAGDARRRTARFRFDYEHETNRPESSGGVLHRIRVDLKGLSADPTTVVEVDHITRRTR